MKTALLALTVAFAGAVSVEAEAEQIRGSRNNRGGLSPRIGRNDRFNQAFERVTGNRSPLGRDGGRVSPIGSRTVIDSPRTVIEEPRVIRTEEPRIIRGDRPRTTVIETPVIETPVVETPVVISTPVVGGPQPVVVAPENPGNSSRPARKIRRGFVPPQHPRSVVRPSSNAPPTRGGHPDGPFINMRQHRALYPFLHLEHDFNDPRQDSTVDPKEKHLYAAAKQCAGAGSSFRR